MQSNLLKGMKTNFKILILSTMLIFIFSMFVTADNIEYIRGDSNNSQSVDAQDALVVLKSAAKIITADEAIIYRADVNRSGSLDSQDALWILKYAAKIIDNLIMAQVPDYSNSPYVVIDYNNTNFEEDFITNNPHLFDYAFDHTYDYTSDQYYRFLSAKSWFNHNYIPSLSYENEYGAIPSNWPQVQYDSIPGKDLYIGTPLIRAKTSRGTYEASAFIIGTNYFKSNGFTPFMMDIMNFIDETNYCVAYKATAIYENDNKMPVGVQLEAFSMEDNGKGLCFNVFLYNVQPGIVINYSTGESQK